MIRKGQGVVLIGCGILRKEFNLLPKRITDRFRPQFLDSMLHMKPALLEETLQSLIRKKTGDPIVYLYGDCCPGMEALSSEADRSRTKGVNCIEICLGRESYRTLRREGTFFLMPEWARRWKEIFQQELGFESSASTRDFLRSSMKKALYLDTGTEPVPEADLAEFAEYTGLPVTVIKVGMEHLQEALQQALQKLEGIHG
ncbi:DUF1638 domain-containing protein [Gracilinema caldarium]|uniref:DUF1638 domain-containing protein n=1 Tax=Gracilinema caldarium TaxID=215591 RepID=UPI0026F21067|nr:DUF1638 domain-containing protein [Gracilinema caldarium]